MDLSPSVIWLLIGAVFCLIEFVVPTAFVSSMMGISALIVAAIAGLLPLGLQIALWAVLSVGLVLASRRLVRTRASRNLDATEAETLTEIPAGRTGRVLYEGNSWAAQCDDPGVTIAAHQKVYIVARQGTTLVVVPQNVLRS
ncbi:MAG: NfeD family protein [Leptodesmis sp.]|uniref:NfeD family protein n=1 Tax=Leptodesmis sp. TaxID=3100501 RepID=UPI003D150C57